MKYVRRLAFAIFTFVIGVAISPIRFYVESYGCGIKSSYTSYRSSYFMQTSSGCVVYESDQEASDAFVQRLNEAVKVFEVKPKVNKKGVLIEQRAVAKFYDEGTDEYYVVWFWREERGICMILSRSYTHVMDFAKQKF